MKKIIFTIVALVSLLAPGLSYQAWAQPDDYSALPPTDDYLLSAAELDDLLAPIALYPDPLIAQILPAATFIDQVDQAARFLRQYGRNVNVDNMPWDVSVKAVAHYPDVLFKMDQRYDWTVALGQAYIDQPQDVMDAIQRLRAAAQAEGNLYSTPQQQVFVEEGYIAIVPASPQYVYVPVYDPNVVYVERYDPYVPFITFSAGFIIGAWLDRDCDWHRHRVYYHGWRGGGWVARSRPHVHDRRGVYINRSLATVSVSPRVRQYDNRDFRQQLRTETVRRREGRPMNRIERPGQPAGERERQRPPQAGRPQSVEPTRHAPEPGRHAPETGQQHAPEATRRPATPPPATAPTQPGGMREQPAAGAPRPVAPTVSQPAATAPRPAVPPPAATAPRPAAPQPAATAPRPAAPGGGQPAPATVRRPPAEQHPPTSAGSAPSNADVYRGRDVQKTQPASQSGFGGYGNSNDAARYRERGQSSRETMRQAPAAPAARPQAAPPPRPAAASPAPAARPAPAPRAVAPRPMPSVPRAAPAPMPAVPGQQGR